MFKELSVIVAGIIDALKTMMWISLLLLLIIYISSVFCVMAIGRAEVYPGYDEIHREEWQGVATFNNYQFFGTIPRSMFSLFSIVILAEWPEIGRAMVEYQPW